MSRNLLKGPWTKAVKGSADPARVTHFLEILSGTDARAQLQGYSAEQATILASVLSGSNALSNLLVSHPDWLRQLEPEALRYPR
ncbi:MAG TPA: hypothetical protein VHI52_23345, partial [Verrucomicrobiae bacterium]|nr:hypothetical protein [Verrucomicrobiae bacterium]